MRRKLKPITGPIPRFRSEAEEREFWETHDSADYVDWSKAQRARFPNLKLSTTAISLRLPQGRKARGERRFHAGGNDIRDLQELALVGGAGRKRKEGRLHEMNKTPARFARVPRRSQHGFVIFLP
jgi:hypothetical protein